MIETIRENLTDASHTAVGLATLAARRVNTARLELNGRFEPQLTEVRTFAVDAVKAADSARVKFETRIDPVVDRLAERLPEPVSAAMTEYRTTVRDLQEKARDLMIDGITFATAVPHKSPKVRSSAAKAATATVAPKAKRTPKAAKAAPASAPKARAAKSTRPRATKRAAS